MLIISGVKQLILSAAWLPRMGWRLLGRVQGHLGLPRTLPQDTNKEKKESYYHKKAKEICLKGWIYYSTLANSAWIRLSKGRLLLTAESSSSFQSLLAFLPSLRLADSTRHWVRPEPGWVVSG